MTISVSHSAANSIQTFLNKLGKPKEPHTIAKTIAEAFNVREDSDDFQFLLHIQNENFYRLNVQIECSEIGSEARKIYKQQLSKLAGVVRYNHLQERYITFKKENIDPNISVLTLLDDALRLTTLFDPNSVVDISNIVQQLQGALDDIVASSLPLNIKAVVRSQISRLIFLLKNYDIATYEQLWEQTSTIHATIYRDAPKITDEKEQDAFGRLGLALAKVIVILTLVSTSLGKIDSALEHSLSIANHLKEGHDMIELWKQKQVPRLEYRDTADNAEE